MDRYISSSSCVQITPFFDLFREKVDAAQARGDTKLYDAIARACAMLTAYAAQHPVRIPAPV